MGNCVSANAQASKAGAAGDKKDGGARPAPEQTPVVNRKESRAAALEEDKRAGNATTGSRPAAQIEEPAEIKVEDVDGGKAENKADDKAVENSNPGVDSGAGKEAAPVIPVIEKEYAQIVDKEKQIEMQADNNPPAEQVVPPVEQAVGAPVVEGAEPKVEGIAGAIAQAPVEENKEAGEANPNAANDAGDVQDKLDANVVQAQADAAAEQVAPKSEVIIDDQAAAEPRPDQLPVEQGEPGSLQIADASAEQAVIVPQRAEQAVIQAKVKAAVYDHMRALGSSRPLPAKGEVDDDGDAGRHGSAGVPSESDDDDEEEQAEATDPDPNNAQLSALVAPFKTVSELNVLWVRGKEGDTKEPYDDLACLCLEIHYQQWLKSTEDAKEKFRFVNFVPDAVVDLEDKCETDEKFTETGVAVERVVGPNLKRWRPETIFSKPVAAGGAAAVRKSGKANNPLAYDFDKLAWLATRWYKENGSARYPSRNQVLDGIIAADKKELLRLHPRYLEAHASMAEVLKTRALAWRVLCNVSGFSIRNMDAPIDQAQLHYLPFHPATNTALYIMQMETPIRYAVNRATREKDASAIKDLGPLAYALKSVVSHANKERDDVLAGKFQCWVGTRLPRASVEDYREMIGDEINLTGYQTATMEDIAVEQAFKDRGADAVPTLLEIAIDCDYNVFKVNRREYTPYSDFENLIMLQDGICLRVESVEEESVQIDGKPQAIERVRLKNIAL